MIACIAIATAALELPLRPSIRDPIASAAAFLFFLTSGVMGLVSIHYRSVRAGLFEVHGAYAVLTGAIQAVSSFVVVGLMILAAIRGAGLPVR
jgi:hypothetical protein